MSITRLVHASVLVEMGATRLYVDPWLYSGMVIRQTEPLGLRPHALPPGDAVLLSDDGTGRLDRRALGQIAPQAPLAVVPPRLAAVVRDIGFHEVRVLAPWQETRVGGVTVTAVPTDERGGASGFVLSTADARVYVAGPTRLWRGLADVAAAFPHLDVALLPRKLGTQGARTGRRVW